VHPMGACCWWLAGSAGEDASVAKFARAWESANLDALVALLTDDVFIAMPPMPVGYEGRNVVARFCASLFGAGRRFDLVPARANGQPTFGAYRRARPASVTRPPSTCYRDRRPSDSGWARR